MLSLDGVRLDSLGVQFASVHVHARAGLNDVDHQQANQQRKRGNDLKIDEGFPTYTAEFAHVADAGDSHHHGQKDNWADHHAN